MINYFAPTVFEHIGITGQSASLFATGFIGIVRMIMTVPALYVIDRLGRRPLMLIGTGVMLLSFFYIGGYSAISSGQGINGWGYLAIALIYVFMSGYSISWGILHYVIPAEIYPQNIRYRQLTQCKG
jgi:MFS family permease